MIFSLTLQKTTDMLLSFTLSNFRSFKAKKTLDLTAATIKEYEESLFSTVGLSVLPSAVLYGANSSGKSNLIEAIRTFLTTVALRARSRHEKIISLHVVFESRHT